MSVINQMLKDLEKRQGDQQHDNTTVVIPAMAEKSPYKNIVIIMVTVLLTLAAVYMFYLHNENQRLAEKSQHLPVEHIKSQQVVVESTNKQVAQSIEEATAKVSPDNFIKTPVEQIKMTAVKTPSLSEPDIKPLSAQLSESKVPKQQAPKQQVPIQQAPKQSSMMITRKQLSPEILAKQKMSRAKEAVANNNIAKAEQLFEDVLLILPSNKDARKQLAALWFGRQSYQAALNLLSQGIHLDSYDNELRLLKAQILIKQQQHLAAFKVLQNHPDVISITDTKYQSMLATQAQTSKQYQFAIEAYQRLTKIEITSGRWWLGLGIAYDSDSQFKLAGQTYHQALNKQDLSNSARQFAQRRLQELGE